MWDGVWYNRVWGGGGLKLRPVPKKRHYATQTILHIRSFAIRTLHVILSD
jgi:hypothetical protein